MRFPGVSAHAANLANLIAVRVDLGAEALSLSIQQGWHTATVGDVLAHGVVRVKQKLRPIALLSEGANLRNAAYHETTVFRVQLWLR